MEKLDGKVTEKSWTLHKELMAFLKIMYFNI